MSICRLRKIGLLLAGFGLLASPFIVKGVMADSNIPKPQTKPASNQEKKASYDIPLPIRKPHSDLTVKAPKIMTVATATEKEILSAAISIPIERSIISKSVFSDKQARLYREIFELQLKGDIEGANKRFAGLNNPILMGHVLAQRYLHPTAYKATYKELHDWMEKYADHPQASKIYQLALSRKVIAPKRKLRQPVTYKKIAGNLASVGKKGKLYQSQKHRSSQENSRVKKLSYDIRHHVERQEPTLALSILNSDYAGQFIDDVEYDRFRAQIAAGYLYAGKLDEASRLAEASLKRSGIYTPQAGWVKGLVYWQKADYQNAAQAFETAATSPYSSGWMVSAAAYWASRANMRAGNKDLVNKWLNLSATYPRTFYGLVAIRALGKDIDFDWSIPSLTRDHIKYIEGTNNGLRAIALIKSGQNNLAEAELENINPDHSIEKQEALLAYANYYQLPALSLRLANAYNNPKGGLYDAALYPIANWQPQNGYRIDQALIHAIVRQESRFQVAALNPSGATGLMQLMPATANYISGHGIYQDAHGQIQLTSPDINLEIGQTYVETLLNNKSVGQDLLSLAIAYNAGPGNLARWKAERAHMEDPLLFIETIPFNETRAFVERVLSNYWIYRIRLNQKTPSLDAVAKGQWARYAAQDSNFSILAMY